MKKYILLCFFAVGNLLVLAQKPSNLSRKSVGLDKVDNTPDLEKPVSKAMRLELNKNMVLQTVNDMRATDGVASGNKAELLGYYTNGDGGGGSFFWDAASTEPDNGGTVFAVSGINKGRWKRNFTATEVNIKWFGAKGDGRADDTDAIQKSINSRKNVYIPEGTYKVTRTINLNFDSTTIDASRAAPKIRGENSASSIIFPVNIQGPVLDYRQTETQLKNSKFGFGLSLSDFGIVGNDKARAVCTAGISISGAWNPIFKNLRLRSLKGHGFTFPFDIRTPESVMGPTTLKDSDKFSNGKATFDQVTAENCDLWGFYFDTSNSAVIMSNSYAHNCAKGGMYLLGTASNISNCSFSYNGTLTDPNACGLQIGDDFKSTRNGVLKTSYAQTFNCVFSNLEIDSNYGKGIIVTGYLHNFDHIRILQGAFSTPANARTLNTPVFVQMGLPNAPCFSTTFRNIIIRTPQNDLAASIFSDGGKNGRAYNIKFTNVFNIYDQPGSAAYNGLTFKGLKYFDFTNDLSRNIVAEDALGKVIYQKQSEIKAEGIPTRGTWNVGDIVYNKNPNSGSYVGWVCTVAGTPGTWKGFGKID
ncbi:glycosyl hydrolase family 28-related protein [Emticicia agri]|uniref:Rhamnogalacturonase A/B/Epimerase-like pectate lyase domain-containing protein n=1 Tax=Emticicia agri TaxID=2492393 RepID=A0A4Q5M370_9BACT|nr:glycosyl hydrolase family 28-related protein [Emticicia agri]RYU96758.1 hypothetical protein EWM59_04275 [Emticicia agri]